MTTRYVRKRRLANQRQAHGGSGEDSAQNSIYGSQVSMIGSMRSNVSRDTITSRNISIANLEGVAPSQRREMGAMEVSADLA